MAVWGLWPEARGVGCDTGSPLLTSREGLQLFYMIIWAVRCLELGLESLVAWGVV